MKHLDTHKLNKSNKCPNGCAKTLKLNEIDKHFHDCRKTKGIHGLLNDKTLCSEMKAKCKKCE